MVSLDISPGSNSDTSCMALSDGPSEPIQPRTRIISRVREDAIRHEGAAPGKRRQQLSACGHKGQLQIFAGRSDRHWAAGVRSAALPAALRRSCITGHCINPKPRRTRPVPQAAESTVHGCQWIPRESSTFRHIPDYLPLLPFFRRGSDRGHIAHSRYTSSSREKI